LRAIKSLRRLVRPDFAARAQHRGCLVSGKIWKRKNPRCCARAA